MEELYILVADNGGEIEKTLHMKIADRAAEILTDFGGLKVVDSWSLNGILSTSSSTFAQVPEQIIVPIMEELMAGATKIEAKLSVSTENTSSSAGEADVYNYTDGAEIVGSLVSLPNGGWSNKISTAWFDVTGKQGKAVRPRIRKESGGGLTQIEGAQLIFKITKT